MRMCDFCQKPAKSSVHIDDSFKKTWDTSDACYACVKSIRKFMKELQ